MNTEKIMEDIQSVQDNIREIKSTWGNTIMTLDNIKSGLKADVQKKVDEAYQRGLAEGKKAFDLLDAEHDAEYQKGFEDGKKSAEKGCEGCKYEHVDEGSDPCCICAKGYIDHYKPVSDPDPIKVGDKVIVPSNSHIEPGELLSIVNGVCYIMWEDKTVSAYRIDGVRCVK